jgi:transcriptional regulator GlxA family with amidase domain
MVELQTSVRIAFLLIDDFALMSYAAAIEPLRAANLLAGKAIFEIEHISTSTKSSLSSSGAEILSAEYEGAHFDIIFVVAGANPFSFSDKATFDLLRQLDKQGVVLGGISGGPVILALAGLMTERRMTLHWEYSGELRERFPELLIERTLYVFDRDRISCAGGIAPLDMMYALIMEKHSHQLARQVSDWFMHTEIRPSGGAQRATLVERFGSTSRAVNLAIEVMENHLADPLTLGQLAQIANVGTRQLNRLFKQHIALNTMAFYRNLRLDKANRLLVSTSLSITEIAAATGFSSGAHLSTLFKTKFRQSPSVFRTCVNHPQSLNIAD